MTQEALPQADVSVASRRHFASVVVLLLVVGTLSLVNRLTSHNGALEFQPGQRLPVYLRVSILEWLMFAYLVLGIHRKGRTVATLIDSCPGGLRRWFSSLGFGIAAAVIWMALGAVIMALLRPTTDELRTIQSFLPRRIIEKFGFAVLTLTAGFCEEFIYRGYLQQQFRAWTSNLAVAIVLQAGLFALLHVTLPWKFVVLVTGMALFLGALVGRRKTLVPAMLLHTVVNLFGGLLSSTAAQRFHQLPRWPCLLKSGINYTHMRGARSDLPRLSRTVGLPRDACRAPDGRRTPIGMRNNLDFLAT